MSKTILLVEDEPALQKVAGEILRQEGFIVKSAIDGEEAIRIIKTDKPDLVLLDLILPKKDGFEVLKEMKADTQTKDIPVIILTNLEGTQDIERALELGAMNYLVKANYELEDIVKRIKDVLK
ncbi:MAG: response regulator [Patescibacteria group bacterium]